MDLAAQTLQFLFSGITNGAIYGLIALGFTIIYNATEVINFAQGELVMLGGMIMIALSKGTNLPLPAGFVISVSIVSIVGASFERFTIRPLKNPTQIGIIIITIGVSILLKGVAMFIWGKETLSSRPFSHSPPIHVGSATLDPQSLWILGITFGILLLLQLFYQKTITGKAMRACAFNKRAAGLVGIPTQKMILLSFVLSAAMGAAAGVAIT
ncbi:MAG: branched-chain amino acid ABC transporter permease, partial [Deltaproteobacteria bacterium]